MYMTVFKPRGRGAKDKIDVPGDVAILEILPAAIDQNRVLPAEKAAVAKDDAIALDANSQRLPYRAGRILKGEVLNREVVRVDESRRRTESADGLAIRADHVRVQVVGENRLLRIFTDQMHEPLFVLHVDEFFVDSRLDVDDCRIVEASSLRNGINGFLNGLELTGAVSRDDNICLRLRQTR